MNKSVQPHRRFRVRIADFVLIIVLGATAFVPWLFLRGKPAKNVSVILNGNTVCEMPLDKDREYTIDGVGKVVVKDGKAFVCDMTCPDKTCEKMGKISSSGNSVICMPNRLAVVVDAGGEVDAVVG